MNQKELKQKAEQESADFLNDLYDLIMGADFITLDDFRKKYIDPHEDTGNEYAIPYEVDTGRNCCLRFGLHRLNWAVNTSMADE